MLSIRKFQVHKAHWIEIRKQKKTTSPKVPSLLVTVCTVHDDLYSWRGSYIDRLFCSRVTMLKVVTCPLWHRMLVDVSARLTHSLSTNPLLALIECNIPVLWPAFLVIFIVLFLVFVYFMVVLCLKYVYLYYVQSNKSPFVEL